MHFEQHAANTSANQPRHSALTLQQPNLLQVSVPAKALQKHREGKARQSVTKTQRGKGETKRYKNTEREGRDARSEKHDVASEYAAVFAADRPRRAVLLNCKLFAADRPRRAVLLNPTELGAVVHAQMLQKYREGMYGTHMLP
jgi:hypothetical protein